MSLCVGWKKVSERLVVEMGNVLVPKRDLKPHHSEFESDLREHLQGWSLLRDADGKYLNAVVEEKWIAYCAAFKRSMEILMRRVVNTKDTSKPFIVGRRKEDGVGIYFARTPFCHNNIERATEEATRLHLQHDDQFFVFGHVLRTPIGSTAAKERKARRAQQKLDLQPQEEQEEGVAEWEL